MGDALAAASILIGAAILLIVWRNSWGNVQGLFLQGHP